tara:strand:+ start:578 stop:862 length:285 start_codon:yes stop_codon:yes gene_type:complete
MKFTDIPTPRIKFLDRYKIMEYGHQEYLDIDVLIETTNGYDSAKLRKIIIDPFDTYTNKVGYAYWGEFEFPGRYKTHFPLVKEDNDGTRTLFYE